LIVAEEPIKRAAQGERANKLTKRHQPPENVTTLAPPENSTTVRKKPSFLARWGVPAAVGVLLIAACILFDLTMNPHSVFKRIFQRSEPVYEWVQAEDRTFSLLPGESKAWGPVNPQHGEIRYNISSYLPIDTAVIDETQWGENMDTWSATKKSSMCYESKIVKSTRVCPVTSTKPQLIFIRDLRPKQFALGGFTGSVNRKTLQDQNGVTVTTFALKCMDNCK